jgi:hypothetical protein
MSISASWYAVRHASAWLYSYLEPSGLYKKEKSDLLPSVRFLGQACSGLVACLLRFSESH